MATTEKAGLSFLSPAYRDRATSGLLGLSPYLHARRGVAGTGADSMRDARSQTL
jgi:hypothetical protein